MKRKRAILYVLMFLPLAAVLVALPFLPGLIPAHYDFSGQITRWGSKYEMLLTPAVSILFGYFMLGMGKYSAKREKTGTNNENVCLTTGIVSLIIFDTITGYIIYTAFNAVESLSSAKIDINQLVMGILGIVMVVIGNVMPKLRMNSVIGLRTIWSMKNEVTWKKSQRFGGISFIAGGAIITAVCFLLKGMVCFWTVMGILTVILMIDIWYTYKISKNF